jgi:hypothetical protein
MPINCSDCGLPCDLLVQSHWLEGPRGDGHGHKDLCCDCYDEIVGALPKEQRSKPRPTSRSRLGSITGFNAGTWWGTVRMGDRVIDFHGTCVQGATREYMSSELKGRRARVVFSDETQTRLLSVEIK